MFNFAWILPVRTGFTESMNHPKDQTLHVKSPVYDGHSTKPGWCFCRLKVRSYYQSLISLITGSFAFWGNNFDWWSCLEATQSGTRRSFYLHARLPSWLRASVSHQDVVDHLSIYGYYLEIVLMAIESHCFCTKLQSRSLFFFYTLNRHNKSITGFLITSESSVSYF